MGFKNAIQGIKHSLLDIITQPQRDSDAKRMPLNRAHKVAELVFETWWQVDQPGPANNRLRPAGNQILRSKKHFPRGIPKCSRAVY